MTPLDIKSEEEWKEIVDRFAGDVKMTACLTDESGNQLFCCGDRFPLCASVRGDKEALTFICAQTNTAMLAVVGKRLQPEVDLCEAGLIRIVVPIVRNDTLIGQVTACGLASHDDEPDAFLVSKQLDISEEKVAGLAKSTPFGSEEELAQIGARLFDELNPKP
ncbi:PocR ligand-binding domain-containing protein [Thermodesulfobacteriota bacterium]